MALKKQSIEVKAKAAEEAEKSKTEFAEEALEKAKVEDLDDLIEKNKAQAEEDAKDFGENGKFTSKKIGMYHPYQSIRFEPGIPTSCIMDSWLKSQINAGLITKC